MGNPEDQVILPEVMAELREAAARAARGIHDPEVMKRACERMARMYEENRRKYGVQDIGVQIIREMRGQALEGLREPRASEGD